MQIHMGKPYCPNRKKSPSLPRNKIFTIISQTRVPKPLSLFLLKKKTKDPSQKVRRLSVIAIFVGKIIMMNLSVSIIWQP